MYPGISLAAMGYNPLEGRYPVSRITALGYLLSPLRPCSVLEKWNPYEISLFEASVYLYGKQFFKIHLIVRPSLDYFPFFTNVLFHVLDQNKKCEGSNRILLCKLMGKLFFSFPDYLSLKEWKKSRHYKEWKKNYVPDDRDTPTVLVDE